MAQRHPALVELSRDHYHGLLLAHQILQEKRNVLVGWSSDPTQQAEFILQFFKQHLFPHFHAEEEGLFPLITDAIPSAHATVEELIADHRLMESFVPIVEQRVATDLTTQLKNFAQLLEGHIRKEERVLFPTIEANASESLLHQIEDWMKLHHHADEHPPETAA